MPGHLGRRRAHWSWAGCTAVLVSTWAAAAGAHPAPAEPPAFARVGCVEVVELEGAVDYDLRYDVPVTDVDNDPDLLPLADTKTHQFFALAARVFDGTEATKSVSPFDDPLGHVQVLPLWVSADDLGRARRAAQAHEAAAAALVDPGPVLGDDSALSARVLPFSSEVQRVSITTEQGIRGVRWDLRGVPVGVYQIAAYTFSPPYNAWTARPGLLRLLRAGEGPPAVWLDAVTSRLFTGQGQRLNGCVSAPEGSRLRMDVQAEGAEGGFETVVTEVPIDGSGRFEACVHNPGINGAWRVRATLETPDGERAFGFGDGWVELLAAPAGCTPDADRCCPEGGVPDPVPPGAPIPGMAPEPAAPGAMAGAGSTSPTEPSSNAPGTGAAPTAPVPAARGDGAEPGRYSGGGCRCPAPGSRPPATLGAPIALVLLGLRRRRGAETTKRDFPRLPR